MYNVNVFNKNFYSHEWDKGLTRIKIYHGKSSKEYAEQNKFKYLSPI